MTTWMTEGDRVEGACAGAWLGETAFGPDAFESLSL